ncbi:recombinase family protein [Chitinophaga sp. 22536]|uniref:recombinase family protein n=1 Tax=unclassified Chitinophaga TaxID=2619133 RepID=UPI003F861037
MKNASYQWVLDERLIEYLCFLSKDKRSFICGQKEATLMRFAFAYFRVSTDGQKETGHGLASQQYDVNALMQLTDIVIVREYFEIESGKKNERPVLLKAIKDCLKAGFILVIAKCDRLTRKALFGARLLNSKLDLIAADKPLATKLDLLDDFIRAEREGIVISKRTSAALQAAKRRGVKLGTACKQLALKNKLLSRAFARKMDPTIQDLIAQGFTTIRALAAELNHRRISPFHGRGYKWHRNTVCNLLHLIKELHFSPQLPS